MTKTVIANPGKWLYKYTHYCEWQPIAEEEIIEQFCESRDDIKARVKALLERFNNSKSS